MVKVEMVGVKNKNETEFRLLVNEVEIGRFRMRHRPQKALAILSILEKGFELQKEGSDESQKEDK